MLQDYIFCYHGTIKRDGEYIKEKGIDLERSRFATDFAKGFYVTKNVKQAEKWAKIKYEDHVNLYPLSEIKPVVIYFILDVKSLNKLTGKVFESPSKEWGQFVLDCRMAGMSDEMFHLHDYMAGPLADGKLMPLLKRYLSDRIDSKEFISGIMPKSNSHHQLSLHTQSAIDCLKLVEVKEIEF